MINFNQLRVFYHAAKYQNFTLAAEKLFISQPAVTAQVKLFEDYCNLKFFKKKGRMLYLTDEGKTLYNMAQKVFEYEKEMEGIIEDLRELKIGILRLGTTKTYARYFMPFLMTGFHEIYPHIKIYLDEGSSLDMTFSLIELKNEIAVIAKAEDHPDICFIPFSQEELVLICPPDHPLTKKRKIPIEALADEPIIMKEIGSGTRRLVNELFEEKGLSPNILMETGNTEFIKQLVQRGDGVSFIVREAVAMELKEKKLVTRPLEGGKIVLEVCIAYLKNQHLSPPAKAFLDILQKMIPEKKTEEGIRTIMARMLAEWK